MQKDCRSSVPSAFPFLVSPPPPFSHGWLTIGLNLKTFSPSRDVAPLKKSTQNNNVITLRFFTGCQLKTTKLQLWSTTSQTQRSLRSSQKKPLGALKKFENFWERSFSYAAPEVWNKLPEYLKSSRSTTIFKNNLKTHLLRCSFESM